MNNLLYKKNLIEKKYKDRENYSLKRDDSNYQIYYNIKVNAKYGQSKFLISSNDIKSLIKNSLVNGPGLFEGTFIKKLEKNYLYLSRPVLSYGNVVLTFKCKLSLGDKWLDWSQDTWREKISDTKEIFSLDRYKNQDSYFLKVKNFYESRCLYPAGTYFVRGKEPIDTLDNAFCGQSFVNSYNVESVSCGEDVKSAGKAYCGDMHNHTSNVETAACGEKTMSAGQAYCGDTHNDSINIEAVSCAEDIQFSGKASCEETYNQNVLMDELSCGDHEPL